MTTKNFSVSDYLIWRLGEIGLGHIFILPGGGCMYLIDALTRQEKIKAIPLLHEQAVGIAAEAYSQYTGNLGVALVTTGLTLRLCYSYPDKLKLLITALLWG